MGEVLCNVQGDFSFVTNWVQQNSLVQVKKRAEDVRDKYFKFLQGVDPRIKGIHTIYELHDTDVGEKWLVIFKEKYEREGFTENIRREW